MRATAILLCVLAAGCAQAPRRYAAPSTAAVHVAHRAAAAQIKSAGSDASAAKEAISRAGVLAAGNEALLLELGTANARLDGLTQTLLDAGASVAKAEGNLTAADKKVETLTATLNATSEKLSKATKSLWWYRLHWWGSWFALGLGVLACIAFAFLKFTGRLALAAAPIAAKIP